jgi:hypothetical protein
MPTMPAASNFYGADAAAIYSANFDYTVIESDNAQPNVSRNTLRAAICRTLSTAAVAAIAFSGILSFPSAGLLPYGVSVTSSLTQQASRSPGVIEMTAIMRERAALATRLFHSAPHPGNDDVEPDYGF